MKKFIEKYYDTLAWLGRIGLPCLAVLVSTMGQIWKLTYTEPISLSITAIAVFTNGCLKVDSNAYWEEHDIVKTEENE